MDIPSFIRGLMDQRTVTQHSTRGRLGGRAFTSKQRAHIARASHRVLRTRRDAATPLATGVLATAAGAPPSASRRAGCGIIADRPPQRARMAENAYNEVQPIHL
ncbi:hypothetical protein B5F89_08695 [Collinsella sp. An307]|nr:hypothetical protein B5F89_08695 [Collinsella sp. An307]